MENIVKQTVDKIFTDGQGRKANRLVMEFDAKINGIGWGRQTIGDIILNAIKKSSPVEALVIRNFASLREMINKINDDIENVDGLHTNSKLYIKTDGYDYSISFLGEILWDSDNNGWEPIIEIEKQIREEIRNSG